MSATHIVMWKWMQPGFIHTYRAKHVNAMVTGLRVRGAVDDAVGRLVLVTDAGGDGIDPSVDVRPLWADLRGLWNASGKHLPSCYRRLKLFDPATQAGLGIKPGDRVCSIDLAAAAVGGLGR